MVVCENDNSFDGLFFYAVRTTGVFCRPSCRSRRPRRENVLFYDRAEQAMREGFRPCKRCRPDLVEYSPMREMAEEARKLVCRYFPDSEKLEESLNGLGISQHRLKRIFLKINGLSLGEYVTSLRIGEAKRMLARTNVTVTSICFATGFGSISAFYSSFRRITGLSPAKYRQEQLAKMNPGGEPECITMSTNHPTAPSSSWATKTD